MKDRDVPWHILLIGIVWAFAFAVDFETILGDTPAGDVSICALYTLFAKIRNRLRHDIALQDSFGNCLALRKCGRSQGVDLPCSTTTARFASFLTATEATCIITLACIYIMHQPLLAAE